MDLERFDQKKLANNINKKADVGSAGYLVSLEDKA